MSEVEKRAATHRRLLLAKELYLHGREHSSAAGAINKMIAVHSLHNAIEVTLRALLIHFDIRPEKPRNIDFDTMLKEIDGCEEFKRRDLRLPLRPQIRKLNDLRNLVQHEAHEPETATMEEWRVHTREFLDLVFRDYFGESLDRISRVSLVADPRLRAVLEVAAHELEAGGWKTALIASKIAFEYAASGLKATHAPERRYIRVTYEHERVLAPIAEAVNENAEYLGVLATGINLIDYMRFRSTPVTAGLSEGGRPATLTRASEVPEETARWGHHFVVDSVIRWQLQGLTPVVPARWATACDEWVQQHAPGAKGGGAPVEEEHRPGPAADAVPGE